MSSGATSLPEKLSSSYIYRTTLPLSAITFPFRVWASKKMMRTDFIGQASHRFLPSSSVRSPLKRLVNCGMMQLQVWTLGLSNTSISSRRSPKRSGKRHLTPHTNRAAEKGFLARRFEHAPAAQYPPARALLMIKFMTVVTMVMTTTLLPLQLPTDPFISVNHGKPATARRRGARGGPVENIANDQDETELTSTPRIEDRPYCTHKCLLGLAYGGQMDEQCPNFNDHKWKHVSQVIFLRLICQQLAKDRGRNADCKPLYISGSRGALLKIRLSSHCYTLVAKGMKKSDVIYLRKEWRVYEHIRPLQGKYVPVCIGTMDLKLPYYYNFGIYTCMLFLSPTGRPLFNYINRNNR